MRYRLKNLVGSPYDVMTASGPAILPAYGEIEAEFSDADVAAFRESMGVEIDSVSEAKKPARAAK